MADSCADARRCRFGPLPKDEAPVVVQIVVFAAVLIGFARLGPPTCQILVNADANDFTGKSASRSGGTAASKPSSQFADDRTGRIHKAF